MLTNVGIKSPAAPVRVDFYPVRLPLGDELVLMIKTLPLVDGFGLHLSTKAIDFSAIGDEIDYLSRAANEHVFHIHDEDTGSVAFVQKRLAAEFGRGLHQTPGKAA